MYTISQLAKEFDISTRTVRYYEELGLLEPARSEGNQRLFSKREYARLKLIIRGKRYGFQLDEIKEMVTLFDKDRTGTRQLEKTIEYGTQKIAEVEERIQELTELKEEMKELHTDFQKRLGGEAHDT
ncbi:MerR family transcriptional regulator [Sutcliffiella horikoshii]|uniref:MerR family transcriptional regulator n=1 Tax=Sutcliffiella horikoshii TaxID=79883 RepID=UPI001F1FF287|nr:MerR family DNA-binding transcriptional regulator [Sutcliffiella horikoshii]MCG1023805.1 MerR family DNA-binding transcriptional regulator [Sutcliffiella horikoshii]